MIDIKSVPVGDLQTNCYIVTDKASGEIAIIDPGAFSEKLDSVINNHYDKIKYILLTHGHYDHIGYVNQLKSKTNAKVVIGKEEEAFLTDNTLNLSRAFMKSPMEEINADMTLLDEDVFMLGKTVIKFLHTPGHTVGGGCYLIDDNIFTGDTLMKLTMGRTDLPTGNDKSMIYSLKKLSQLEGDFNVFPGHGETSLLSYEKKYNSYIRSAR